MANQRRPPSARTNARNGTRTVWRPSRWGVQYLPPDAATTLQAEQKAVYQARRIDALLGHYR
jgi:hypothetical protein